MSPFAVPCRLDQVFDCSLTLLKPSNLQPWHFMMVSTIALDFAIKGLLGLSAVIPAHCQAATAYKAATWATSSRIGRNVRRLDILLHRVCRGVPTNDESWLHWPEMQCLCFAENWHPRQWTNAIGPTSYPKSGGQSARACHGNRYTTFPTSRGTGFTKP